MSDKKKNYKVISLSVKPEMHALMTASAKKAGYNLSELVRELVEKHLSLIVNDGESVHAVIDIPIHLKGNAAEMQSFLNTKTEAIVKKLCDE